MYLVRYLTTALASGLTGWGIREYKARNDTAEAKKRNQEELLRRLSEENATARKQTVDELSGLRKWQFAFVSKEVAQRVVFSEMPTALPEERIAATEAIADELTRAQEASYAADPVHFVNNGVEKKIQSVIERTLPGADASKFKDTRYILRPELWPLTSFVFQKHAPNGVHHHRISVERPDPSKR